MSFRSGGTLWATKTGRRDESYQSIRPSDPKCDSKPSHWDETCCVEVTGGAMSQAANPSCLRPLGVGGSVDGKYGAGNVGGHVAR